MRAFLMSIPLGLTRCEMLSETAKYSIPPANSSVVAHIVLGTLNAETYSAPTVPLPMDDDAQLQPAAVQVGQAAQVDATPMLLFDTPLYFLSALLDCKEASRTTQPRESSNKYANEQVGCMSSVSIASLCSDEEKCPVAEMPIPVKLAWLTMPDCKHDVQTAAGLAGLSVDTMQRVRSERSQLAVGLSGVLEEFNFRVISGVGDCGIKMLVDDLVYFLPTTTAQLKHHLHPAQVWALIQAQQNVRSVPQAAEAVAVAAAAGPAMQAGQETSFVQHLLERIVASKTSIQEFVQPHELG